MPCVHIMCAHIIDVRHFPKAAYKNTKNNSMIMNYLNPLQMLSATSQQHQIHMLSRIDGRLRSPRVCAVLPVWSVLLELSPLCEHPQAHRLSDWMVDCTSLSIWCLNAELPGDEYTPPVGTQVFGMNWVDCQFQHGVQRDIGTTRRTEMSYEAYTYISSPT